MRCLICRADLPPRNLDVCPACGVHLPSQAANHLRVGSTIGRGLRIREVAGQGSYGVTYHVIRERDHAHFALKEFFPTHYSRRIRPSQVAPLTGMEEKFKAGQQRFRLEALVLRDIHHPNIVNVHEVFSQHGTEYISMSWLTGETLRELLDRAPERRLPPGIVRRIFEGVVLGLTEIHQRKLLHLDLKPENIMILPNFQPVLIDFGAARYFDHRERAFGRRHLTPKYAPPELVSNQEVDGRTDLFSAGMVLHECLLGSLPPAALERLYEDGYEGANCPEPWKTLIDSALTPALSDRPDSVAGWWYLAFGRARRSTTSYSPAHLS